ncbi:glycosyltransferase family 2 protein [Paenibacillus glycinis]|uniref:Glycosyltransferase n=1 Tax=Paenibacillus glycinis TaxID=2697035 RepID=A0ABW9XLU2_9BACL|nr:glycosyltransferase family 2 protein [Paenibacillus glycinis]NBD23593.1 glycosyltransferase [Paenibacillus glycinis]
MTKNEEKNIAKCIHSVQLFDEVFVVDSGSSDNTAAIAEQLNALVVPFEWNGMYPKKKQWCLENLPFRNDWVLYVDADEEVRPELAEEMMRVFQAGPQAMGYFVGYDYVFMNKVLRRGHQVYKLVLFNRHHGKFLDYDDLGASNMWEVEGHYQPEIAGKAQLLQSKMLHFDHDSIFDYFSRHNRYSDWEATVRIKGLLDNPKESQPYIRVLQKKLFNKLPLKWLTAFLHSYVFKLGFLDGKEGFHFAFARAVYYWQVEIKISELKRRSARSPVSPGLAGKTPEVKAQ